MSYFPRKVFIHAPGDLGQGVFHHEPNDGYTANVEYVRSDIAEQEKRELVELLSAARNHIDMFGYALADEVAEDEAHEVRRKMNDTLLQLDRALLAKHEATP